MLDAPREDIQVLFRQQKQQSPPLESSLPWAFKCSITGQSTLNTKHIENPENWLLICFNIFKGYHT
jgi:hypothetical protein